MVHYADTLPSHQQSVISWGDRPKYIVPAAQLVVLRHRGCLGWHRCVLKGNSDGFRKIGWMSSLAGARRVAAWIKQVLSAEGQA